MTTEAVKVVVEAATEAILPSPDLSVLRQGRRKPPPFPVEILGTAWNTWLKDAADGAGAPVDYVVGALLATAAATIGNARSISPWDGWVEPSALWIANVGSPSSGKSPGVDPVLNLLRTIESGMAKGFEEKRREWETANAAANHARENWQKAVKAAVKDGAEPPVMPATAEAPPEITRPPHCWK